MKCKLRNTVIRHVEFNNRGLASLSRKVGVGFVTKEKTVQCGTSHGTARTCNPLIHFNTVTDALSFQRPAKIYFRLSRDEVRTGDGKRQFHFLAFMGRMCI